MRLSRSKDHTSPRPSIQLRVAILKFWRLGLNFTLSLSIIILCTYPPYIHAPTQRHSKQTKTTTTTKSRAESKLKMQLVPYPLMTPLPPPHPSSSPDPSQESYLSPHLHFHLNTTLIHHECGLQKATLPEVGKSGRGGFLRT